MLRLHGDERTGDTPEVVLLVGQKDTPTDGVDDYCRELTTRLGQRGFQAEIVRVARRGCGWPSTLSWLWTMSKAWRRKWVLVQYTAWMWPMCGVPIGLVVI